MKSARAMSPTTRFSITFLEFLAEADVEGGEAEEAQEHCQDGDVSHGDSFGCTCPSGESRRVSAALRSYQDPLLIGREWTGWRERY
jgi:hypothetical protein